jgi:integrase
MAREATAAGGVKRTYQVRFWAIKTLKPRADGKKPRRPYGVRWVTAGHEHSEWFTTKALANKHLQKLQAAANGGEAFDSVTGLPESMYRERNSRTLLQVAQRFIAAEWPDASPNTRCRQVDTLGVAVGVFLRNDRGSPPLREIRRALTGYLLQPNRDQVEVTARTVEVAEWIVERSRPVSDLADQEECAGLLRGLTTNLNGRQAAPLTVRTRRGALFHLLQFAVRLGELNANPLTLVKTGRSQTTSEVDPRVVVNTRQGPQLLAAVTYVGRLGHGGKYDYLYAFFASMYYAALRPAEANWLREGDCTLPETGWGELVLSATASRSNARYIGNGKTWEERSLKKRPTGTVRVVPIPPQLVAILRAHVERFGTTPDGRLFRGRQFGEPINPSIYTDAWKRARVIGLTPEQAASPLARRPYDLRHAAVSTWLAAGVPVAEVAERAGHTVEVLLKVYARCLDGERATSNQRIDELLS